MPADERRLDQSSTLSKVTLVLAALRILYVLLKARWDPDPSASKPLTLLLWAAVKVLDSSCRCSYLNGILDDTLSLILMSSGRCKIYLRVLV